MVGMMVVSPRLSLHPRGDTHYIQYEDQVTANLVKSGALTILQNIITTSLIITGIYFHSDSICSLG